MFADAVELLGPTEGADHCRALVGLGKAQQLTSDPAYRKTLLDASRIAATLQDAGPAAGAALANTRGFMSLIGDLDEERCDAIERALELDDCTDPSDGGSCSRCSRKSCCTSRTVPGARRSPPRRSTFPGRLAIREPRRAHCSTHSTASGAPDMVAGFERGWPTSSSPMRGQRRTAHSNSGRSISPSTSASAPAIFRGAAC